MTATRKTQPRKSNERRIIERPRLMKVLEEAEARTILLLAPAGYGKTTLARQWAKTLNGVLFLSLTSAHQDVSVLATELAASLGDESESFVRTYVEARSNPQRAGRSIASALAKEMAKQRVQWLILDDFHELGGAGEAEQFLAALYGQTECRVLIASRNRPEWTDARLAIYGEVVELTQDALAMDQHESQLVLGTTRGLKDLLARAGGWPAVIGLAAATGITELSRDPLPTTLHAYLTNELFKSADETLRHQLLRLALAVDLEDETLTELFGSNRSTIVRRAADLGFLSTVDGRLELHPLFREYLLQQLAGGPGGEEMIDPAIAAAVRRERWERAFQLILRFRRHEQVAVVLERAYSPLLRSGRLGTLSSFAASVRASTANPPLVVDLAEAEVGLRDGAFEQASRIAIRVALQFPPDHPLLCRANMIVGQSAFARAEAAEAEAAYRLSFEGAQTLEDEAEALRGWALASIQGEVGDAEPPLAKLAARSANSAIDLLRYASVRLVERRFNGGLTARPPEIDEGLRVVARVDDPRTASSFLYSAAYVLGLRAEYEEALLMMDRADELIAEYDLDFARPYACWNRAWLSIGQRRFGNADRLLQLLEDDVANRPLAFHVMNCRILRARMAMQTGRSDEALDCLPLRRHEKVIPSIQGEYLATRALAFAVMGDRNGCEREATEAERMTTAAEVRLLSAAARAVAKTPHSATPTGLWHMAEDLGTWDPLLAALRASTDLADLFAAEREISFGLGELYERANDLGLARRAGLRVRSTRSPEDILTPRELEVLGMLAQGLRNQDIAKALVVSPSTIKVHVRHIFEKLGVRTRAQAVARFGLLSQGDFSPPA